MCSAHLYGNIQIKNHLTPSKHRGHKMLCATIAMAGFFGTNKLLNEHTHPHRRYMDISIVPASNTKAHSLVEVWVRTVSRLGQLMCPPHFRAWGEKLHPVVFAINRRGSLWRYKFSFWTHTRDQEQYYIMPCEIFINMFISITNTTSDCREPNFRVEYEKPVIGCARHHVARIRSN